ncbi:MAG: peptide deformylase [Elusimicrobiota bacterium]|jgi:peptide deformylase
MGKARAKPTRLLSAVLLLCAAAGSLYAQIPVAAVPASSIRMLSSEQPEILASRDYSAEGLRAPQVEILPIITIGDPILLQKAAELTPSEVRSPQIREFILDMLATLGDKSTGVGLAAPQVGKSLRIAVIATGPELLVIINPKVTVLDPELFSGMEGCFSLPYVMGFVSRPRSIRVDYLDELGQEQSIALSGSSAVTAQHEIDHLDGILFTMRQHDYPSKFGLGDISFPSERAQLEMAHWLASLDAGEKKILLALADKITKDMGGAVRSDALSSLKDSLDPPTEENIFLELLAYYRLRVAAMPSAEKADALAPWINSPERARFVYDDLTQASPEDENISLLNLLLGKVPALAALLPK